MLGSPSRARFATIPGLALLVLAFVLVAEAAWASSPPAEEPPEPSSADLALIRQQITEARRALDRLGALAVPEVDRKELARRIQAAAEAVSSYERLAEAGPLTQADPGAAPGRQRRGGGR